ncbi:putative transmembrane protein [Candidatus Accumulibacter aalborgensis]|uniref:Putative transmembrane protein n=1 Tax=Candidatus Accumulibacter aalborgensis TaxID=1860102 RepID=A0A1A8XRN7_9PROT|nr:MMPL family transporter [Candidatus Accumulibacter aalborgensis]SBT07780.1 putative transmembrane protein [Candidatus Accumulibacter aalborgensis]
MTTTARRTLLLWSMAMLAGAAIVWNSRFSADISFFLPAHPNATQQVLVEQLTEGAVARLLMLAVAGGDARQRAALSHDLRARLASRPEFAAVNNGETQGLATDQEYLFAHRYVLSPAVTPQRFSVTGLRAAIGESIDLLASPVGLLVKRLLPQDPTGEFAGLVAGLDSGRQPNSREGVWATRDGERALLLAQTAALGSDTDGQATAIDAARAAFAAAASAAGAADLSLQIAGPGVFAVHARAMIKEEVTRLTMISALAIVALLFFVYRSFTLVSLGLLPVASGALAGVVAVSLACGTVFGITVGFGSALIGEAVDYSIYYFVQAERNDALAWRSRFWPTVRLGMLTSVCGFGVLLFSGFPGLAQLGLYALSGLVTAAAVTRFVLPQLVPAGSAPRDLDALGHSVAQVAAGLRRLRWPVLLLALLAAALLLANRGEWWNSELSALSTASAEDLATDSALRAELGAPDARLLIVLRAADRENALQSAERAGHQLDRLVAAGVIGGYDSPARYLPSEATQAARRASLPTVAELRERLPRALAGSPLAAGKLDPFLRDVDAARVAPPVGPQALHGTTLALAVDALLRQGDGGWSVLLPVRSPPGEDARAIDADALRAALAGSGALVIDLKSELDGLYTQYLAEARLLSLIGLAAIVGLLAATLRSPRRVLGVIVPLLLAVLIVTAGLHLAGVRLQLLHLIGLLLIVAVGSNYALFFDRIGEHLQREPRTAASMLVACLTTTIGFGTLAMAKVPVLQALGVTVGPGAILALVLSACFAPAARRQ